MQSLGLLILAVAVATGSALPLVGAEDRMKELILAVTDFARSQAALQDPMYGNSSASEDFDRPDIKGSFGMSNGSLSGFSNIVIDSLRSDPEKLAAHVRVRFPQIRLSFYYSINGEAELFGQKVSGSGRLNITLFNASLHLLYIRLVETESMGLKVQEARIHPDVQDLSVEIDGLSVKGLSVSEFENSAVLSIYDVMSTLLGFEMLINNELPRQINLDINGRSMDEVIQWLKDNKNEPINPVNMLGLFQL